VTVESIDPTSDPRWLEFLQNVPGATVFSHPAWFEVLRETYGYTPVCLAAIQNGACVGVLPLVEVRSRFTGRRGVCLPFSDASGPSVGDEPTRSALVAGAEEMAKQRRWKYIEIRDSVVPASFGVSARYKTHRTSLRSDPAALLKSISEQPRRKLKKAQGAGVRVEQRTDGEALRMFIRLNALTRRKHGVLPQPDAFFWNLRARVLERGLGYIGTATVNGRIVAANIYLHWNRTVVYKYGASEDRAMPTAANYALMWDAMRLACERGFSTFDFGRTDLTNVGLLQFKRGWATEESDLLYARSSVTNDARRADSPGLQERLKPVISLMPVPILKLIGSRAYPHVG
jgi:CelD/BcsL family acetyltransferase involved in cellulose biosynthesis